jgi:hypothetical protein
MTISVAACEPECQAGQQVHMVLLGVWIPTAARGSKRMATKTAITGLWTQDGGLQTGSQCKPVAPWPPFARQGTRKEPKQSIRKEKEI